ncbi:MAG: hypothetical protein ACFFD2_12235, partial [Promethearchaeota archaeon]
IDSISDELVKEPAVAPIQSGAAPKTPKLIDVKRDYDYLGSDIRFKVALRNITKTTISKISVLLNVPDQFRIERNVKNVEILNPNETRGVDFLFTPLACGKGQIFGTVSYTDAFGEPHSVIIRSKEIWVKCPLVKSKKTSVHEAEIWREELQKNTTTINTAGITKLEAFRIGCDQITALDLAEVEQNEEKLKATFSGIAKVTGDRLLVEVSIHEDNLILDVFTSDQKQATGFLAYMRNLIKMSLDVSKKLRIKSEKLGIKVLTAFQIAQSFFNICDHCEIHVPICDFLLQLREIQVKTQKEFPEINFLPEIATWYEELEMIDENEPIPESKANLLEYDILQWIKEVENLAEHYSKIYLESFDTPDVSQEKKITNGIENIRKETERVTKTYSLRIPHYLLIISKLSGLCLYSYKFNIGKFDPDLISGFLSAIQSFGIEFSSSTEVTGMRRLSYKNFEITLEEGEHVRAALVSTGKITNFLENQLRDFLKVFSDQFQETLSNFDGDVAQFKSTKEIVKKFFALTQKHLEGGEN